MAKKEKSLGEVFTAGFIKENPVLRLVLGTCPTLAVTTMAFDGLGMGLGFTLALSVLGIVRELLGSGSIFGYTLPEIFPRTILMILPPGAFFTLAFLMVIFNLLKNKKNA